MEVQCLKGKTGKNLRRSTFRAHPCSVRHSGPATLPRRIRRRIHPFFQFSIHSVKSSFYFLLILNLLAAAPSQVVDHAAHAAGKSSPAKNAQTAPEISADP